MRAAEFEVDVAIVGAGVVGLAVAEALSRALPGKTILLIDRHSKFGWETSSHNSEVVHAGIYYKGMPLKALHCRQGRELLYQYCTSWQVPVRKTGKYIVATSVDQLPALDDIVASASQNGVLVERKDPGPVGKLIGNSAIVGALWSPTTGIVDSHSLMRTLEAQCLERGVMVLYRHKLVRVSDLNTDSSLLVIEGADGEQVSVRAHSFVNSGGLGAARIAEMFLEKTGGFEIRACRGRYFKLSARWNKRYAQLIYPVPDPRGGLGVHLTFDLAGQARLGPDVDWVSGEADNLEFYKFEDGAALEGLTQKFFEAGQRLFPDLQRSEVMADYVGVRPKLFVKGQAHKDFMIHRGANRDWHLLGIESPGLTAALSLAEEIKKELVD